jgi:putative phosphoribosyl transferase
MNYYFKNRTAAGHDLAAQLERYRGPHTLVLGLPRGGVVVADAVARVLGSDLNVIVSRKIGAPGNPEYAVGAVAEGGGVVVNLPELRALGLSDAWLAEAIRQQEGEIAARVQLYRHGAPLPSLVNRPTIVVDDGVATGFTMLAALRAVRRLGASPVVMATPVTPPVTLDRLSYECDDAVALATPEPFYAVGFFYEDFEQVSDEEVVSILHSYQQPKAA